MRQQSSDRTEAVKPTGLSVRRYQMDDAPEWNAFVAASKNGTFLFDRGYMDYHGGRFIDHSLIVDYADKVVALLPAHLDVDVVHSHNGLTYGGFVISDRMTTPLMLEVFAACSAFLRRGKIREVTYKTVPHIYHLRPAEEDRYALFRRDAVLYRRDLLSTIDMGRRLVPQLRRRRGATKAGRAGVEVRESADWEPYWALLTTHLEDRYGVRPVHSLSEILLLHGRFPRNIRLFTATQSGRLLGGLVIYETETVAHLQYAAANQHGLAAGCLDLIFFHLLDVVFAEKRWFDFGNSTQRQGRYLNSGLVIQKEGFGARAIAHDFYRLTL
jgi:Acetyltransferase (GNAT) domain